MPKNIKQKGLKDILKITDFDSIGGEIYRMVFDLYPICRSITGNGVRETLQYIKKMIPLEINEIPSGTKVFDWSIPKEWNIRDAYVKDSKGNKVIDFRKSNLHILNYSIPVQKKSIPQGTSRTSFYNIGTSGMDPLQDVIL